MIVHNLSVESGFLSNFLNIVQREIYVQSRSRGCETASART